MKTPEEKALIRRTMAEVQSRMRRPSEVWRRGWGHQLIYNHGAEPHSVSLVVYTYRNALDRSCIWRLRVGHEALTVPGALLRRIGCDTPSEGRAPVDRRCPRLELSALAGELHVLAMWLPEWIEAAHAGARTPTLPVNEFPCARWGTDYVWTAAGWATMEAWNAERSAGAGRVQLANVALAS